MAQSGRYGEGKSGWGDDGALHFFLAVTYAPLENQGKPYGAWRLPWSVSIRKNPITTLSLRVTFPGKGELKAGRGRQVPELPGPVRSLVGESPLHNFQMGIIYQRLGKHREALEVFRGVSGKKYVPSLFPTQALPSYSELVLHMAYSLFCINDRQNALKLINSSAPQKSEVGRSWEWLGTKAFLFENIPVAQLR